MVLCKCPKRHKRKEVNQVNKALLEYEIKKNGFTIAEFCEKIGISKSAYYRKCNGSSEFGVTEIRAIMKLLNLQSAEAIFFADEVS